MEELTGFDLLPNEIFQKILAYAGPRKDIVKWKTVNKTWYRTCTFVQIRKTRYRCEPTRVCTEGLMELCDYGVSRVSYERIPLLMVIVPPKPTHLYFDRCDGTIDLYPFCDTLIELELKSTAIKYPIDFHRFPKLRSLKISTIAQRHTLSGYIDPETIEYGMTILEKLELDGFVGNVPVILAKKRPPKKIRKIRHD
jgi:hypothetical protein